jgi:hypothetical protein
VPRGEVVGAVQHDAAIGDCAIEVGIKQLLLQRDDLNFGIEGVQRLARFVDFRRADARRAVQDLTLQVGEVDLVRVGEGQLADAAGCEVERCGAAEPAGADDQRGSRAQPLLPLDPDFGKEDVAAVAEELLVVQCAA